MKPKRHMQPGKLTTAQRCRGMARAVLSALLFALLSVLLLAGCHNPLSLNGADGPTGALGVLRITFVQAEDVGTLTLTPDTQIANYVISGSATGGVSFLRIVDAAQSSVEQSGLIEGLWNISIDARNAAEEVVLTGSAAVMVNSGQTQSVNVVLQDPEGNGTLSFELQWPEELLFSVVIDAELQVGGDPDAAQSLTFAVDHAAGSAQYSGVWPAGFHILAVTLLEGGHGAWGDSYAVQLTAGAVTAETVVLSVDDLNPPPGPGSLSWAFTIGEAFFSSIWSSPARASDGTIYVGSDTDRLYAVNPDGSAAWNFETGGRITSSPAVGPDHAVIFGSHDRHVYLLESSGAQRWRYETGGWVRSSAAIGAVDGGSYPFYIGSNDGYLYAFDSVSGFQWRFGTGDSVVSSPAIGPDGRVFFGSQNGGVYAVSATGVQLWAVPTGDWVYSSPAIGPGIPGVNEAGYTVYVGSYSGTLYALNAADGTVLWQYNAGNWIGSSPAIGPDGIVYVGSRDGILHAVNAQTGTGIWTFNAGQGGVYSSPAVGSDGTIYVGSYDRNLYAINPDGSEQWRFATGLGGIYSSPLIGPDGTVYVGGRDGTLYALVTGSAGPADSPWPMFGRDAARSGRAP